MYKKIQNSPESEKVKMPYVTQWRVIALFHPASVSFERQYDTDHFYHWMTAHDLDLAEWCLVRIAIPTDTPESSIIDHAAIFTWKRVHSIVG